MTIGVPMRRLSLVGLVFGVLVFALGGGSALAASQTATFSTQGCGNTVAANLFTVPAGVSSVTITATGSAGAGTPPPDAASKGGTGDVVSGTLSGLSGGQVLDVCVDYGGGNPGPNTTGLPGFEATPDQGGGASGVALGSDFTTPVLIAAGGGGTGALNGGNAGYPNGGTSGDGAGGGGTQSAGGPGGSTGSGVPGSTGYEFSSAGPGAGGDGGYTLCGPDNTEFCGPGGGGGGAGYFGGGGGAPGSPGGGGSDFCASSLPAPVSLAGCAVTGQNSSFGTGSVTLTYTTNGCPGSAASFIYPQSGASGVDGSVPLSWCAAAGATEYYLTVGTSPGAGDVVNSGGLPASQTSFSTGSLPAGETLYATIYTYGSAGGAPVGSSVTFTTASSTGGGGGAAPFAPAAFTIPADGQSGVSTTTTFAWGGGSDVGSYYLTVGTSPGAGDVVNSGSLPASQTSYASSLPAGRTLYASIYTYPAEGGGPSVSNITFTTGGGGGGGASGAAAFTYPTDGQTGVPPNSTIIQWSAGNEAGEYYLIVGTSPGAGDVINSGALPAAQTTYFATLPAGKNLYATIYTYSLRGGAPTSNSITFTTG